MVILQGYYLETGCDLSPLMELFLRLTTVYVSASRSSRELWESCHKAPAWLRKIWLSPLHSQTGIVLFIVRQVCFLMGPFAVVASPPPLTSPPCPPTSLLLVILTQFVNSFPYHCSIFSLRPCSVFTFRPLSLIVGLFVHACARW